MSATLEDDDKPLLQFALARAFRDLVQEELDRLGYGRELGATVIIHPHDVSDTGNVPIGTSSSLLQKPADRMKINALLTEALMCSLKAAGVDATVTVRDNRGDR